MANLMCVVVLFIAVSRARLPIGSISGFFELLGCLWLLEVIGWGLLLCRVILVLLGFLCDVVGCTLLHWLQNILLRDRELAVVLDEIFLLFGESYENAPVKGVAFALVVLKRGFLHYGDGPGKGVASCLMILKGCIFNY